MAWEAVVGGRPRVGVRAAAAATALICAAAGATTAVAQEATADRTTSLHLSPRPSVRYLEYQPTPAIAWHGDSAVLLLDRHGDEVELRPLRSDAATRFGREGGGPGEFDLTSDVAVGPGGDIYVADPLLQRVSRFDATGGFVDSYPASGAPIGLAAGGGAVYALIMGSPVGGGGPTIARVSPARAAVRPLFDLAEAAPDLLDPPEDALQTRFMRPLTAGADGRLYVAAHYDYHIAMLTPEGERIGGLRRDVDLVYPDEAEIAARERRWREAMERAPAGVASRLDSPALRRIHRIGMRQPRRFFRLHGLTVDDAGGLWVATQLRAAGDSTRVDYFAPESETARGFLLRDRVVALAASHGRLAALVERLDPVAFGRYGLDIYRIEGRE